MGRERSRPSVGAGNVHLAFSLPDFQISNLIRTEPPASVFLGCFVLFLPRMLTPGASFWVFLSLKELKISEAPVKG